MEVATEEPGGGGEIGDRFAGGDLPAAADVGLRVFVKSGLGGEQPDAGRGGPGDLLFPIARAAVRNALGRGDGEFHVRLARAEPDLADHDIREGLRGGGGDLQGEWTAGRLGGEFHRPRAIIAGSGRRPVAREGNGDGDAGPGAAPDGDRRVALEDHAVGEDMRRPAVGVAQVGAEVGAFELTQLVGENPGVEGGALGRGVGVVGGGKEAVHLLFPQGIVVLGEHAVEGDEGHLLLLGHLACPEGVVAAVAVDPSFAVPLVAGNERDDDGMGTGLLRGLAVVSQIPTVGAYRFALPRLLDHVAFRLAARARDAGPSGGLR